MRPRGRTTALSTMPREERHLGLAPDERRSGVPAPLPGRRDRDHRPPGVDRLLAALDVERAPRLVADRVPRWPRTCRGRRAPRRAAHGSRAGARCSRRRPSRCSRRRPAARRRAPRRCSPRPASGRRSPRSWREPGQRLLHPQRGPHRPLGVVLVGHRRAEQGHDRVADDLVDPAAERRHVLHELVRSSSSTRAFTCSGSDASEKVGEPDEVGEERRWRCGARPGRSRDPTRRSGRSGRRPGPDCHRRDSPRPQTRSERSDGTERSASRQAQQATHEGVPADRFRRASLAAEGAVRGQWGRARALRRRAHRGARRSARLGP